MLTETAALLNAGLAGGALAYVDPGTGSFLLQLLLGTAVGAFLSVKMFWSRLRGRISGLLGRSGGSGNA